MSWLDTDTESLVYCCTVVYETCGAAAWYTHSLVGDLGHFVDSLMTRLTDTSLPVKKDFQGVTEGIFQNEKQVIIERRNPLESYKDIIDSMQLVCELERFLATFTHLEYERTLTFPVLPIPEILNGINVVVPESISCLTLKPELISVDEVIFLADQAIGEGIEETIIGQVPSIQDSITDNTFKPLNLSEVSAEIINSLVHSYNVQVIQSNIELLSDSNRYFLDQLDCISEFNYLTHMDDFIWFEVLIMMTLGWMWSVEGCIFGM